jgi:hypothetical protein
VLVLFVMRKKKHIGEDSKKDQVEEVELENRVGRAVYVEDEYPL